MQHSIYEFDLPETWMSSKEISIDTEATGLNLLRDRLCIIQCMNEKNEIAIIKFPNAVYNKSKNLKQLLANEKILKIFHFARFDVGILYKTFKTITKNIVCTRILSKLCRTYSNKHGLKEICRELLQVELDKTEGCSYWGDTLSENQINYAIADVLYLKKLYLALRSMAEKENKIVIAERAFDIIQKVIKLDCVGIDSTEFLELI